MNSPERGLMGFGCDLLPASIRGGFSGSALSENAIGSLKTSGYKASHDQVKATKTLQQRRLVLEKEGAAPFHVVYRWPESQAFLNRAFWHQAKAVSTSEVETFFGSWVEGWTFYKPWQSIGIGECSAHFAFPTSPTCEFIVGSETFVTRCTTPAKGGEGKFVVECMMQKENTEADEAAVFKALDRGLSLATKRAFGDSSASNASFVESARSAVPDLWARGRRHTLRTADGRQTRETLVAAKGTTIYALWAEWEGTVAPPPAAVQRFFNGFKE